MFKKGTCYSKACLVLVRRLGKKNFIVSFVGLWQRLLAKVTSYLYISDPSQHFRKRTGYSKACLV